jgi:hypothetical protein
VEPRVSGARRRCAVDAHACAAFTLAALLAGVFAGAGCGSKTLPSARDPIVLVGFDSADWTWIDPQLIAGKMPHFAGMEQRGVRAALRSLSPPQKSPTIWTSIATGKRPYKHGVGGFTKLDDQGLETSAGRTAATYWEILGALGRKQAVIGWWMTYPPTPVNGVLVSDYVTQYFPGPRSQVQGAVTPDSLWHPVDSLRVSPDSITLEQLARFVDVGIARAHGDSALRTLGDLRWIYAADETFRRAARKIYAPGRFDVFSLYFRGLDAVSHTYWQYFKPKGLSLAMQPWEIAMCDSLIPNYYQYVDELLGEVLGYVDPRSRVIVCSDHGFHGYRSSADGLSMGIGMHSDYGILMMAGPDIRSGVRLQRAEVKDIMPTILVLSGVPPAQDLDGHILGEVLEPRYQRWVDRLLTHAVASYEPLAPHQRGAAKYDPAVEKGILEQLRALGYIQ